MSFNPGDPVYACLPVANALAVAETDDSKRLYRDTIQTSNKWLAGDTIKIKDPAFMIFGSPDSALASNVILKTSTGNGITCTSSGQGTGEIAVTLQGSAPDGDTIQVHYRVGIQATYERLLQNRGQDLLNLHKVAMVGGPKNYVAVYNQPHRLAGSTATLNSIDKLDGLSIQTNPPA